MANSHLRDVYVVDGNRTPFLKVRGVPGPFSASDLAVDACQDLLQRQNFEPHHLDEVIAGCVMPRENEANIGRVIALRLGCGKKVPGWTVQRNCASGMQALDSAWKDIGIGRCDLVLAGGTEAMSHAPAIMPDNFVNWLGKWQAAKSLPQRLKLITQLRASYLKPINSVLEGLTDPVIGLSMGQTAENLAYEFNISRRAMDEYALRSHQRWVAANEKGYFKNVLPIADASGKLYSADDGIRADTTLEKLAALKPIFDKKFGTVTAGNSSQVTDGAAFVILASDEAVKKYKLPVLGRIVDAEWVGVDPAYMGLGPAYAVPKLLQRHNMKMQDIDYWEINEAFAAQVLACLAAWTSADYCEKYLGLPHAFGVLNQDRLNVDGGAIAIGHPVGASGARIVFHLLEILRRNEARYGVATLCVGGGQGGAMLIENQL